MTDSFAEVGRRANPKVPTLRGRTVATLFFEDSTRTRMSFETAAKRMSADVLSFAAGSSSVKKGESLRDTIETIQAIGMDAVIIRHSSSGRARPGGPVGRQLRGGQRRRRLAPAPDPGAARPLHGAPVARRRRRGRPTPSEGLRVTIVGDIRHSRVARSQITAYAALGAEVTLVAPATLLPPSLEGWPVASVSHDLDRGARPAPTSSRCCGSRPSGAAATTCRRMREYSTGYALTARRALQLPPDAIILHPGPMVRGVEIASEVAELPSARITDQVGNGVAVRMAVLFLLLGQGTLEGERHD